jgi:haloacetate dehalogenase
MDEADFRAGNKVHTPLLAIWGSKSHTGTVYDHVLEIWRTYATNVVGGPIDCGHYVPEEAPEPTLTRLLQHFPSA